MLNYCTDVVSKLATSTETPVPDPQEPRPGRLQGVETDEGARLPGRRDLGRSEGEVLVRLSVCDKHPTRCRCAYSSANTNRYSAETEVRDGARG